MSTLWTHVAASHAIIEPATPSAPNAATGTLSGSIQAGDLLVALCTAAVDGIPFATGLALTDTGSGGWQQIGSIVTSGPSNVAVDSVMQWKVATLADVSASLTLTSTPTTTTAGTLWYVAWLVSVWRPPAGTLGLDLTASVSGGTASLTTLSVSPGTGSTAGGFPDALAVTGYVGRVHGTPVGTNTFTGASGSSALGNVDDFTSATDGIVTTLQGVGGVTASATAGSNSFVNTFNTACTSVALFGLTFTYANSGNMFLVMSP